MKSQLLAWLRVLREPAWWTHAASVAVVLLITLVPNLSGQAQSWWDAVIAAVAGVVVAFLTHDGVFAALLGFMKAVLLVMLGYGWVPIPALQHMTPDQLAAVFTILAGLSAAYTRTQAVAPQGPGVVTASVTVQPPTTVTVTPAPVVAP